jgi:uncharacterized membrane protein YtjA (UPF0391 family)
MMIWTLGFLAVALLAALLGLHGLATGAAGLACVTFIFVFFTGTAFVLWRLIESKRSTPHL